MKIGYIRVSRDKQTTALQEDAMRQEQCERVFTDKMSGKRFDRPEFLRMLDVARKGDVIVVWRLDRLGRSLKQLIETVTMFILLEQWQNLSGTLSVSELKRV
jgi:DNA invertase Pin-like site-specific DNA recombinase